jgi:hypothetical protein
MFIFSPTVSCLSHVHTRALQTQSNMALFRGMQQVSETVNSQHSSSRVPLHSDPFLPQLSAAPAYVQKLHAIRSEMDATRAQVKKSQVFPRGAARASYGTNRTEEKCAFLQPHRV